MEKPLPINGPSFLNSDEEVGINGDFAPELYNGYLDEFGATHQWPGTSEYVNVGNTVAITGLYWWERKGIAIAVDESGNVYRINKNKSCTDITGTALTGKFPPTFADDGSALVIANGGAMVFTDGYTVTANIGDADAPTSVTHVAFYDSYILAKDIDTDTWYWSDTSNYASWSALSFATAESSPDKTLALIVFNLEIQNFGTKTIENYYNDGTTPFVRNAQALISSGCGAAYSVTPFLETIFYLNDNNIPARISGRQSQLIGKAVEKYIQGLGDVTDAIGFGANIAGRNFYILSFLKANVSLAYDVSLNFWYQPRKWNVNKAEFDAFIGRCYCYAKGWNMHLLGSRLRNGSIYEWSPDYYQENGDILRLYRKTGNVNHGTKKEKKSGITEIRVTRGEGDPTGTEPYLMMKIRNDSETLTNEEFLGLGNAGDRDIVIRTNTMGKYRNRQWMFIFTDNVKMVMADAVENVEVLGR